jgi:predicted nucleic acid-binding protein
MIFLLDVNALIALGFENHLFHRCLAIWLAQQPSFEAATCSITELGFVRVLSQTAIYGLTVREALAALDRLRTAPIFLFAFSRTTWTHPISPIGW